MNSILKLFTGLLNLTDGKLYDAYVSYLHGDDHSASFATTFALHVLPEVLEDRLGYKLFISGRDALPGAGKPTIFLIYCIYTCLLIIRQTL